MWADSGNSGESGSWILGFLVFDDLENQVLGILVLGFLDLSKIRLSHSWIFGSWICRNIVVVS